MKMNKMEEANTHIFWLYHFGARTNLRKNPDFTLCEISTTDITIHCKPDNISIPLVNITKIELFKLVGGHRYNAAAKLTYGLEACELYLWVADPFTCQPSAPESIQLQETLIAFKADQLSSIEPNPYLRELKRKGRDDEFLRDKHSAHINPKTFETKMTIKSAAINVVILIAIILVIFTILGLVGSFFSQ